MEDVKVKTRTGAMCELSLGVRTMSAGDPLTLRPSDSAFRCYNLIFHVDGVYRLSEGDNRYFDRCGQE